MRGAAAARIGAMMRKELIHVLRDPRMKIVLLAMPLVQTLLFGYAVNSDSEGVDLVVCDLDRSPRSRQLAADFTAGGFFDLDGAALSIPECVRIIESGDARAALVIPPSFDRDFVRRGSAGVELLVDGTEINTASASLGFASGVASSYGRAGRVPASRRAWFNPLLQSRLFFVPGVVANVVMLATLMLSCMAVVREHERGTMEQILVTPITKVEFMLGKTLPFVAVGLFDAVLITGIAVLWFRIPFAGSPLALLASILLYLLSALGVGLLISTVSRTQQQAMMTAFLVFFPAIMLSGFAYPISNMPAPIRLLTLANPLRYMMVIVRGVFLRGEGFADLWREMAGLAAIGSVLLGLAVIRFRKRIG